MLSIPQMVARSDLIAVVPRQLALVAQKSANIKMFPLPFECPNLNIPLMWHRRFCEDAAHKWLRSATRRWASLEAKAQDGLGVSEGNLCPARLQPAPRKRREVSLCPLYEHARGAGRHTAEQFRAPGALRTVPAITHAARR